MNKRHTRVIHIDQFEDAVTKDRPLLVNQVVKLVDVDRARAGDRECRDRAIGHRQVFLLVAQDALHVPPATLKLQSPREAPSR